jgi:hypothetical protein
MTSPPSSEYNLFIKPSKITETLANKDDKSTEYIIMQNNMLFTQHVAMKEEIQNIKTQFDELEEYNSSLERGKTCIQGIAKNQYLLNIENAKMIIYYKAHITTQFRDIMFSNCNILPFIIACFVNTLAVKISLCIVIVTIQAKTAFVYYKRFNLLEKTTEFKDLNDKIKKLDKSNETLHDLIDNY